MTHRIVYRSGCLSVGVCLSPRTKCIQVHGYVFVCVPRVGLAPVSLTLPPDHSQASTRATTVGTLSQNEHAI